MTLASLTHLSTRTLVFPGFEGPRTGTEATIRVYRVGRGTVLEAAGDLGWVVTRGLRGLLRSTPSTRVVVDLPRVTFVDQAGVAVRDVAGSVVIPGQLDSYTIGQRS